MMRGYILDNEPIGMTLPLLDGSSGDPNSSFALVLRARAGDQAACEALFARYHQRLQQWAHGRLPVWARGSTDTMDVVRVTCLQLRSKGRKQ